MVLESFVIFLSVSQRTNFKPRVLNQRGTYNYLFYLFIYTFYQFILQSCCFCASERIVHITYTSTQTHYFTHTYSLCTCKDCRAFQDSTLYIYFHRRTSPHTHTHTRTRATHTHTHTHTDLYVFFYIEISDKLFRDHITSSFSGSLHWEIATWSTPSWSTTHFV